MDLAFSNAIVLTEIVKHLNLDDIYSFSIAIPGVKHALMDVLWLQSRTLVLASSHIQQDAIHHHPWLQLAISKIELNDESDVKPTHYLLEAGRKKGVCLQQWETWASKCMAVRPLLAKARTLILSRKKFDKTSVDGNHLCSLVKLSEDVVEELSVTAFVQVSFSFPIHFSRLQSVDLNIDSITIDDSVFAFLRKFRGKEMKLRGSLARHLIFRRGLEGIIEELEGVKSLTIAPDYTPDLPGRLHITNNKFPSIEEVCIEDVDLQFIMLSKLTHLTKLVLTGSLSEDQKSDYAALKSIAPQLEQLDLSHCTLVFKTAHSVFGRLSNCCILNIYHLYVRKSNNRYAGVCEIFDLIDAPQLRLFRGVSSDSMIKTGYENRRLLIVKGNISPCGTTSGLKLVSSSEANLNCNMEGIISEIMAIERDNSQDKSCYARLQWLKIILKRYAGCHYLLLENNE